MRLGRSTTVVIVAGCLIALITFGLRTSLGLFTEPLSVVRGWDRETFAIAIAVQNLVWGLGQPFGGGALGLGQESRRDAQAQRRAPRPRVSPRGQRLSTRAVRPRCRRSAASAKRT